MQTLQNKYYAMRHGESEANIKGIIISDPKIGTKQYGLSELGKQQVQQSIAKTEFDHNTIVISSDFKRAMETANIIHQHIQSTTKIIESWKLRERYFGEWDGLSNENYQQVWLADTQTDLDPGYKVESVNQVTQRFLELLLTLESTFQKREIILVSHGDTLQIGQAFLQNIDPHKHRTLPHLSTAEIRRLNFAASSQSKTCTARVA